MIHMSLFSIAVRAGITALFLIIVSALIVSDAKPPYSATEKIAAGFVCFGMLGLGASILVMIWTAWAK